MSALASFDSRHVAIVGLVVLVLAVASASCSNAVPEQQTASVGRANPASEHCVQEKGKHTVERRPDGGEFGVCLFEDNRQCEEWALLRGQCPAGGLRVTGFITAAARYCAITGGKYTVTARSGASDEQGSCALPSGTVCEAEGYYRGACQ